MKATTADPSDRKTRPDGGTKLRASSSSRRSPSHVVGVGGSAGSLEPLERFFRVVPRNTTMAFVVLTHGDPREHGMMAEILARFTSMPVREASPGVAFERGCVYVVPSNKQIEIRRGRLELVERPTATRGRAPIDALFRAIASAHRERSVGVVLSGMGADGTTGLAAIKEALGVTLVQDPATAAYDAMPRSAIGAGLADFIAAPEALAERLDGIVSHAQQNGNGRRAGTIDREGAALAKVLAAVRARTGNDFTGYKKSTMSRRIERRMQLHRVPDLARYSEVLERDPAEIDRLEDDLLIGVTRFFRDSQVFDALSELAIPALLRNRTASRPLRVWVAGCATGEEAYSLAIVIREQWERHRRNEPLHVQIFATDLVRGSIDRARRAVYSREITNDVSPERLARFFVPDDGGYRVKEEIREMVVFATQNLVSHPPFTKLDILSCRNVLIYMEPALQRKVLALFLYALVPRGVLFLGTSENVTGFEDGLKPVASAMKLFRRGAAPAVPTLPAAVADSIPFGVGRSHEAIGRVRGRKKPRVLGLRDARKRLATLTEEMNRSEETLNGVNEQLQSTNEELQSTNEELTTSKEEMQSMNEELLTLNAELQTMNEQLATTNDDMRNLLDSSQIPTLFLDKDLRLKRYTAQATPIARLIPGDVGRPITDIVWSLRYETLARDVNEVLDTLVVKEAEVVAEDGTTYRMRIHPYRTTDDVIDGVVMTFMDVTAYKREATDLARSEREMLIDGALRDWPGVAYVEDVAARRSLAVSPGASIRLGYSRAVLESATEAFWSTLRQRRPDRRDPGTGTSVVVLRHADGTLARYRERTVALAKGTDGRVTHVLHAFRPLRDTAKKEAS